MIRSIRTEIYDDENIVKREEKKSPLGDLGVKERILSIIFYNMETINSKEFP